MSSISGMERVRRREGVRNQQTRDLDPGHSKVRPLVTQPHVFRVRLTGLRRPRAGRHC